MRELDNPSPFKARMVFKADYSDFDRFIQKEFGLAPNKYSIVADEELGNCCSKEYNVTQKEIDTPHESWDQEELDKFLAGEMPNYITQILLVELAKRGRIAPGDYVINIFW